MDKNCEHQKVYYFGENEYYFFTWSIPHVFCTNDLNLNTAKFQIANSYFYHVRLNVSTDRIVFNITSNSSYLKCFVSLVIGSGTLVLSNILNQPTSNNLNDPRRPDNRYFYELVNLSSEHENFQELKQHLGETLKFICRLIYRPKDFSTGSLKTPTSTDSFQNLRTLAAALKDSSESEKISLQVGEETETVSKVVLCARSPVFAKMFENDMTELQNNVVTITDIEMPVIKVLVSFMYTSKLLIRESDLGPDGKLGFLCDLYYASDKYNIVELRQLCVDLMIPLISMENLNRVMKLAFSHNDELLKSTVLALIATNIDAWFLTNDWKDLVDDHPEIAAEILSFFDF